MKRRIFYWLIRLTVVAALALTAWAGWYVYHKGFTRKWRQFVTAEFHKRGVEISFTRLTLDPVHGLVARDVVIVDSADRNKRLADINRIALDINIINFLRGKPFIRALDLLDARLSLPLNPSNRTSPAIVLSHLNARMLLWPNQIYLSQAEAQMYGFHVTASGRLINPAAYHPASPGAGKETGPAAQRGLWLPELAAQLNALRFEGEPPRVDIQFSGDLAQPENIFVQATLWAEKIKRNRYRLENLYAALDCRDRIWTLKQLVSSDSHGRLDAAGSIRMPAGDAELSLKSTLDLQGAAAIAHISSPLDDCVFHQAPSVDLTAKGNIGALSKSRVAGRIALRKFSWRQAEFESLAASFLWEDSRWYVDDFKFADRSGELVATAMRTPAEFRCKVQSTINPRALLPLLSGQAAEALAGFEFDQSPQIALSVAGPATDLALCKGTGELRLGRTRICGVPLDSATAGLVIGGERLRISDVDARLFSGRLQGSADLPLNAWDPRALQGSGTLSIVNGNLFAVPIFAPLAGILNGIAPGLANNTTHQASASFEVQNGVLVTADFNAKGQGFEMTGTGNIHFLEDKMEFNIRIKTTGLLPGKVFEYNGDGPLSKPGWRPAKG